MACASSPGAAPSLTVESVGNLPSQCQLLATRRPSTPGSAPRGAAASPLLALRDLERGAEPEPTEPCDRTVTPASLLRKLRRGGGRGGAVPPHTGPALPPGLLLRLRLSLPVCRGGHGTRTELLGASRLTFWFFFSCDHLPPGQDVSVQFKQQQRVDPVWPPLEQDLAHKHPLPVPKGSFLRVCFIS